LITPVLNAGGTLADTIASIRNQDFADYEWIVQDGGSNDGCVDLWKDIPQVNLEIAPDSGLYNAMNKAVARSGGRWLVFLQADDWLEPGALGAFAEAAINAPGSLVLAGGSSAVKEIAGNWKTVWERNSPDDKRLDFSTVTLGEPMLNARAYRRDLWEKYGGFSTRWSLAADRAWLLELCREDPAVAEVAQKVYRYRWHEGSKTMNAGNELSKRLMLENLEIAETLQKVCRPAEISILKSWHTKEATLLAMNQSENFEIPPLLDTLLRGTKNNPLMSISFLCEFFRCLPGFLARGGRTKSTLRRMGN
jgi:glycosyltransferase involved in cell wall biosynthesis